MPADLVADASAVIKALTEDSLAAGHLAAHFASANVHAPHLVDAEVGDVLRRQVLHGNLDNDVALAALLSLNTWIDERYPHAGPLAQDAWALRDRVRFYDGLYVALAARLEVPLITADAKLSRAHGLPCAVEVV